MNHNSHNSDLFHTSPIPPETTSIPTEDAPADPAAFVSLSDVLDDEVIRRLLEETPEEGCDAFPSVEEESPTDFPDRDPLPEEPRRIFTRKTAWIIAICSIVFVLLAGAVLGCAYYKKLTHDDGLILPNVFAGDISLGGMSREQAAAALKPIADAYANTPMDIHLGDITLSLSSGQTGAKLDVDAMVDDIFSYGRTGSPMDYYRARKNAAGSVKQYSPFSYLNLDTGVIRSEIEKAVAQIGSPLVQTEVKLEGKAPALDPDSVKKGEIQQKLIIIPGSTGVQADCQEIYDAVLSAYSARKFEVTANVSVQEPDPIDLDGLYKKYAIAPVDAKSIPTSLEIIPEVYGLDFDLEGAKAALKASKPGQAVEIPFRYQKPKVLAEDLEKAMFADTLAYAETYQFSGYNRATNLRLACEAINGTVVMPGQVFSFNDALGERTAEKGYLPATAYVGGEYADSLGGGICQVASTLYYACLHADLEIVERACHMYPSDYVPYGMDATVYWEVLDFCFRNNTTHPIRIDAIYDGESVCLWLKGVDDRTTYVEMEYVITGYIDPTVVEKKFTQEEKGDHYDGEILQYPSAGLCVDTYRCRYDRATGKLISREYEDYSRYDPHDKIICRIDPPPTVPTEPPTEPTTEPTTEPPTEPTTEPVTEPTTEPTSEPATEPEESSSDPTETSSESGADLREP